MEIFPIVLTRLNVHDARHLLTLRMTTLDTQLPRLMDLEMEIDRLKNEVCDLLYREVSQLDGPLRRRYLNLKRDIFNLRPTAFTQDLGTVSKNLDTRWEQLKNCWESYRNLQDLITSQWRQEKAAITHTLWQLAKSSRFQKGLSLGSGELSRLLQSSQSPPAKLKNKNLRGIYKYLTRAFTKSSPFSTFTSLHFTSITTQPNQPEKALWQLGPKAELAHSVRFNTYLLRRILILLADHPFIYPHLPLKLNTTVAIHNQHAQFFFNCDNLEAYQSIKLSPIVELISSEVKLQRGTSMDQLYRNIAKQGAIAFSAEAFFSYTKRLVDCGFLEWDWPVSGRDAFWEAKVIHMLEKLEAKNTPRDTWCELLEMLIASRQSFEKAHPAERLQWLGKLEKTKDALLHSLATFNAAPKDTLKPVNQENQAEEEGFRRTVFQGFKLKRENLLREDTFLVADVRLQRKPLEKIVAAMKAYVQGLLGLPQPYINTGNRDRKAFFIDKYGPEARVPLLEFYKVYFQEFGGRDKPTFANPVFNRAVKKMIATLSTKTNIQKDVLHLSSDSFSPAAHRTPNTHKQSFSGYFEYVSDPHNPLLAVLESLQVGFGKWFSRFLYSSDSETLDMFRRWNQPSEQNELWVENCDSTFHNANIHPQLFQTELQFPGSQNSVEEHNQLPIVEIAVICQAKSDQLGLVHMPSGKLITIFNSSFQTDRGRSLLFRFLNSFSYLEAPQIAHLRWLHELNKYILATQTEPVKWIPRIVFEDRLVIQRKSWLIPTAIFRELMKGRELDTLGLFRLLHRHKLPSQLFLKLAHDFLEVDDFENAEAHDQFFSTHSKPQYIDFFSPPSVELFKHLWGLASKELLFTEALPHPQQYLNGWDKLCHAQMLVQWR